MELDEALARFQVVDLEYGGGLSNHGPMAAEALVTLGHPALVPAWADRYAPRLLPLGRGAAIPEAQQSECLGRPDRAADWVATFEAQLAATSWPEVLQQSVGRLADGLFAGATHGWLRVAHAVRALADDETPVRRRELAFGLATWACRYQTLPGEPGSGDASLAPGEALLQIPLLPESARRPGLFFDVVRPLDDVPEFATAVARVGVDPEDASAWLSELCRMGARLYLAHPSARIAYAHVVTAPSALRLVSHYLDHATACRVRGRLFQSVAALHAAVGSAEATARSLEATVAGVDDEVRSAAENGAEIRYRAACSMQEHAIKLAEACLREDAVEADLVLRVAAADAALHITGGTPLC